MPSVVQTQTIPAGYMLNEKSGEPIVSAFTAVNGRGSPTSPHKINAINGSRPDTIHVRGYSQPQEHSQDQKLPLPGREQWSTAPRVLDNNNHHHTRPYTISPESDGSAHSSPTSLPKRKRSSSAEDERYHSPESQPSQTRHRMDSYTSNTATPNPVSQSHPGNMELQQRTLPPMERPDHERNWQPQSHEAGPNGTHHRDPRAMEGSQDNGYPNGSQANGESHHAMEPSSTTEITRAGVQVDPKKRKRQFANRTKTGCGTCRRRKKKCDEAKPDCNNCARGGFICEGYAHKVPWPKNGINKSHPPLQAKDQTYPLEPAQLYHNHGTAREGYPVEAGPSNGTPKQPIVVEEHNRQAPRNGWAWNEGPRPSHPPEQSQPPEYTHAPPPAHSRPPPSEHYAPQPTAPGMSLQRQHNPRIYHHTPQTMSQVVHNSPGPTAEPQLHHQHHAPVHQSHPAGPPGPPPAHYPAPHQHRREKSEKDKMLSGEPFRPYDPNLITEREHCKVACYSFNMTLREKLQITPTEKFRHFQALVLAKWIPPPCMSGHVGAQVHVDTPFNCDYGYNLVINDMVTIGPGCNFLDSAKIKIGRNSRICANVTIDTQRIPTDSKSVKGSGGYMVASDVDIGENVYIGANCTIAAGVRIGTGAIIHPGSVVLRDVPRDSVARGNPAVVSAVNWDD